MRRWIWRPRRAGCRFARRLRKRPRTNSFRTHAASGYAARSGISVLSGTCIGRARRRSSSHTIPTTSSACCADFGKHHQNRPNCGSRLTGTMRQVDIVTGTLGKSLGGAMGGFVAASQPIIDLLRQRARPYLFSNSLALGSRSGIDRGHPDRGKSRRPAPAPCFECSALSSRDKKSRIRAARGRDANHSSHAALRGWRRTWRPRWINAGSTSPRSSIP